MDTLNSPSGSSAKTLAKLSAPAELLRERARWQRFGSALLCLNTGLLLTLAVLWKFHPSFLRVTAWEHLPLTWVIGTSATILGALAFWVHGRRSASLQGARSLDENLQAMNRLEAVALLASQADPVARAQREETAAFLVDHCPRTRRPDYPKILFWAVAALLSAHLVTLAVWTRPWQRPAAAPAQAAPKPPPAAPPKATITWKTPKSEIKASPIEEVPLEATADSATGLRDIVLEAAVNGAPHPGVPVPNGVLSRAGSHPVQTSLYLDQLEVEPYDVVSYFLRAKRIVKDDLPDIVSSVQFVEVKPFRDDVREVPGGDGTGLFALLTALKVAQLNLLKQNFVLGHAEISRESAAWKKENTRVGDEQTILGKKADEVIAQFIQKGAPANIVDLLQQSRSLMDDSAEKIRVTKNTDALAVQGKSLGLITEIEKYFVKLAAKNGSGKGPKQVKDPFEKPKDFELKQRFDTVAGGLEALAQEQLKLAKELARADPKNPDAGKPTPEPPGAEGKKPDPNRIEGTFTERQTLIAQRIGALLNQQALPPEVNEHLGGAQEHARESLRQLDADDIAQAREPTAAAARELRLAAQAMDRLGDDSANDKLADALNALNRAADEARNAADARSEAAVRDAADAAAAQAAEARDKLADAARLQQETGSAQAAARLREAVRALDDAKLREALKQWHDQPRNEALRQVAAEQLASALDHVAGLQSGKDTSENIAKLVERVERTRANFERLASAVPTTDPGQSSPDAKNPEGQSSGAAPSPANPPNGEPAAGNQSGLDATGQPKGDVGQLANPGSAPSPGGLPSNKKGAGKAAQGKDGKKDGSGQKGKGTGPGKGNNGKDEKGEGQGQGKAPGQGGGQPSDASNTADQPSSGQSSPPAGSGGTGGRGRGGQGSAAEASSERSMDASPSTADDGKTSGSSNGDGSPGDAVRSNGGSSRRPPTERLARELMADLRDETLEARVVLVDPDAKQVLDELRPDIHSPQPRNNTAVVASYERIRAPLERLITLLRVELDRSQRQHELTDQTQEKAPSAYGEAVADYFEQLSRDYRPSGTPVPETPADAGVTPTQ